MYSGENTSETNINPLDLVKYVFGNMRSVLFWSIAIMAILVFGNKAFFPDKYTSRALVQVRGNMFEGKAAEKRNRMAKEEILSASVLKRAIKRLDAEKTKSDTELGALEFFAQMVGISIKPKPVSYETRAGNLAEYIDISEVKADREQIFFSVSMSGKNPEKLSKVVNAVVEEYIISKRENKHSESVNTAQFLENHLDELEVQSLKAETELADFKMVNAEYLVEPTTLLSTISSTKMTQATVNGRLNELRSRLISLDATLSATPKYLTSVNDNGSLSSNIEEQMTPEQQLSYKRNRLVALRQKYKDGHPTIKALLRDIMFLKSEVGTNVAEKDTINTQVNISAPMNPQWLALDRERSGLEAQMVSVITQIEALGAESDRLENIMYESPSLIDTLTALQSKTDALIKERDDIRQRLTVANITAAASTTEAGNGFKIVDPANIPAKSETLPRQTMYLLAIFGSFVVGAGITLGRGFLNGFKNVCHNYSKWNRFAWNVNFALALTGVIGYAVFQIASEFFVVA